MDPHFRGDDTVNRSAQKRVRGDKSSRRGLLRVRVSYVKTMGRFPNFDSHNIKMTRKNKNINFFDDGM
jgi:hypothetical protein